LYSPIESLPSDKRSGSPRVMKVLHVITSLQGNGAEGALYRLCVADVATDHTVFSLMDEGVYGPKLTEAGVKVRCAGMPRGRLTLAGLFRLWRTIREVQPDVIQTWMYHADFLGGLAAWMAGNRRVVWGIRNTELDKEKSGRSTVWVAWLCARLSGFIPARIAVCARAAERVHAELGYSVEKMTVIPNGYDLGRFRPEAEARQRVLAELSLPEDRPLLGMIARFDPFKDHGNLLSALALLVARGIRFHCLLVGEGLEPGNRALDELLSDKGLYDYVSLLGRRDDVPAIMSALDVHVLSSSSEAFPNVVAEAMACGTPCVCTDVGDAANIIGDTGWLAPPSQPEALSTALLAALDELRDSASWGARQQRARARIERYFGMEAMVCAYRQLWAEVDNKKRVDYL